MATKTMSQKTCPICGKECIENNSIIECKYCGIQLDDKIFYHICNKCGEIYESYEPKIHKICEVCGNKTWSLPFHNSFCITCGYSWKTRVNHAPNSCLKCRKSKIIYQGDENNEE